MSQHSIAIPAATIDGFRAARTDAARVDRRAGRIMVSGRDRAAFLHGLLTNDIAALTPGRGCYAAYLTPQGRMITDLWVYEIGDAILLTIGFDIAPSLAKRLD